jgi:hypothetical protein
MGNQASQMAAKNQIESVLKDAKEGLASQTATKPGQKERDQRAIERAEDYQLKQAERAERKKKLSSQWAQHKKENS